MFSLRQAWANYIVHTGYMQQRNSLLEQSGFQSSDVGGALHRWLLISLRLRQLKRFALWRCGFTQETGTGRRNETNCFQLSSSVIDGRLWWSLQLLFIAAQLMQGHRDWSLFQRTWGQRRVTTGQERQEQEESNTGFRAWPLDFHRRSKEEFEGFQQISMNMSKFCTQWVGFPVTGKTGIFFQVSSWDSNKRQSVLLSVCWEAQSLKWIWDVCVSELASPGG